MPYIVGIIAILEAESGMPASQNKQTTTVGQIVSIMRRPDSWPLAALMAFVAIGWVQWVHTRIFESHDANTTGVVVHWLRDGSLAFPLALIATGCGFWVADRFVAITTAGGRLVSQACLVAVTFALLLVPMVAVHTAIDGLLGGPGGLGSLEAAPGAGYLDAVARNSFEANSGFIGELLHGLRDSAIALVAALPVALVGLVATRAWRQLDVFWVEADAFAASTSPVAPLVDSVHPTTAAVPFAGWTLSRRELLRYGGAGTMALALSSAGVILAPARSAHAAGIVDLTPWLTSDIELFFNDGIKTMIDGVPVYSLGYGFRSGPVDDAAGLHTPGPVIWTHEGEQVTLRLTNNLSRDHSFVIDGIVDETIGSGQTKTVSFPAPGAGTYLYQDGVNRPVNRVLGLQGTMIVMPADGSMRLHPQLSATHWTFHAQWVWQLNEIDPAFNAKAQAGMTIRPEEFVNGFVPRYFTINGRMGSIASHEETAPDTAVHAHIGEPQLIRIVNGGLATHSPHIHGNHVYVLAHNARLLDNIPWKDAVMMMPEDRKDVILPYVIPPNAVVFPPDPAGSALLKELHGGREMEGRWPMHCHIEMSQSAGGGLYPQGMLTDWTVEF
jgi:FtsP/CotA-like multicopper oxidase with cupredoxin domain